MQSKVGYAMQSEMRLNENGSEMKGNVNEKQRNSEKKIEFLGILMQRRT